MANLEFVEDEIENNDRFLKWVDARYQEIEDLVEELQDERCESSLLFVTRIREHYEAQDAVSMLKDDLKEWVQAGMPTSLAELKTKSSFKKLA